MEEFLELMKQTPAWQRPGLLPYAPRGDRAEGPVSKVFRSRGGKELLHRLLSDDTTASMQAQRQMLLSEGGFAHLASTVISLELASRMDAEPNMSVAVIQQLVALKAKLVAIQESAFRTAAAVRQGPVHLLLKSSGATQVNVNVNSDDKDDAITLI